MRKTKIKTETGIIVEIKATENVPENVESKHFAGSLRTSRFDNNPIISEKKIEQVEKRVEKTYLSSTNSRIYKALGEPIWKAKPENTDKNALIYAKKPMQMPIFKEEKVEIPENKQIEVPIIAEKPAKKEISKENLAEMLVLKKKVAPVVKEVEIRASEEKVAIPAENEAIAEIPVAKTSTKKKVSPKNKVAKTKEETLVIEEKPILATEKTKKEAITMAETPVPIHDEPEIWTDVREADSGKYRVSNYGRVTSRALKGEERFLKGKIQKHFCNVIELRKNGKTYGIGIGRLVALHFVPNPENKTHVVHIDRNYHNNYYKNLKWVDAKEVSKMKTWRAGKGKCKINYEYAVQIRKMIEDGIPQYKIAKMFCISSMQVTRIKRSENWGK